MGNSATAQPPSTVGASSSISSNNSSSSSSRSSRAAREEDDLALALAMSLALSQSPQSPQSSHSQDAKSNATSSRAPHTTTNTSKVGGSSSTTAAKKEVKGNCPICLEDDVVLIKSSSTCTHAANCCIDCVRNTIREELEGKGTTRVKCPSSGCGKDISAVELISHTRGATKENHKGLYARLDHLLTQAALRAMPEFRNCSNPRGCGSGQLIEGGEDASNFFDCHSCHFRTCINHRAPHHRGLTCAEYDAQIKERDEQSDAWKAVNTKKCPKCKVDIEKNEGCDAMTCCVYGTDRCNKNRKNGGTCDHGGFCGQKFCWLCLGEDRPDGSKFHNTGCQYFGYT